MEKKNKNSVWIKNIIISIIIAVFSMVILLFDYPYKAIDNLVNAIFLNDLYGDGDYCMFVHPLLGKIVSIINKLFPYADGYLLLIRLVTFGIFCALAFLILTYTKKNKVFYWMLFGIMVIGVNIPNQNFTIRTASVACVGMFIILLSFEKKRDVLHYLLGIGFIFMGTMGRMESFYLTLPFLFLEFVIYYVKGCADKGKTFKRIVSYGIPICVIVCIMAGTKYMIRYSDKNASDSKFNEVRSTLVDYPVKEYEELSRSMEGVSINDYELLKKRFTADTDIITAEYLQKLSKNSNVPRYKMEPQSIVKIFKDILKIMVKGEKTTRIMFALAFLLVMVLMCADINIWEKIQILLSYLGIWVICGFFTYKGRFFDRIAISVLLPFVTVAFVIFIKNSLINNKIIRHIIIIGLSLLLAFSSIIFIKYEFTKNVQMAVASRRNVKDEHVFERDSNYYIWESDSWCWKALFFYQKKTELPTEYFLQYNIPWGGSFCTKDF